MKHYLLLTSFLCYCSLATVLADESAPPGVLVPYSGPAFGPESQPGSESTDLLFIVDGSGSIAESLFEAEILAITQYVQELPRDGSVAVGVLQFSSDTTVEVPLTVVSSGSIGQLIDLLGDIERDGDASKILGAMSEANIIMSQVAAGAKRRVILISDAVYAWDSYDDVLVLCNQLRTRTTPVSVRTLLATENVEECPAPDEYTAIEMREFANAPDLPEPVSLGPRGCYTCSEEEDSVYESLLAILPGCVPELPCSEVLPMEQGTFAFYKEPVDGRRVLFSLGAGCASDARFGEAVNGEFTASREGELVVLVAGTSDETDVFGSNEPNGPGWQEPDVRNGEPLIGEKHLMLDEGDNYQFNVRTGKGQPSEHLAVTFSFYWEDEERWCIQEERAILDLVIEPIRSVAVDPVIPARARLPRSLGEDTAIRIPQCTHGPEDRGNLSDWFVAWPTVPGAVIPEGHAKGWRINGNTLISPAETRYVFGE